MITKTLPGRSSKGKLPPGTPELVHSQRPVVSEGSCSPGLRPPSQQEWYSQAAAGPGQHLHSEASISGVFMQRQFPWALLPRSPSGEKWGNHESTFLHSDPGLTTFPLLAHPLTSSPSIHGSSRTFCSGLSLAVTQSQCCAEPPD